MVAVRLGSDEIDAAAALIARAFHDETLTVFQFPDEVERRRLAPVHFERVLRLALATGEVWRTPAFDAVACWVAPGRWPATSDEIEVAGLNDTPNLIGHDAWTRFRTVYEAMDRSHAAAAPQPHWDLWLIAVDPQRQGQGLGSSLLLPMLRRFDAAGDRCYLETLDERTLALYRRHGFVVLVDAVEPTTGVRYWCCVRDPARASVGSP